MTESPTHIGITDRLVAKARLCASMPAMVAIPAARTELIPLECYGEIDEVPIRFVFDKVLRRGSTCMLTYDVVPLLSRVQKVEI